MKSFIGIIWNSMQSTVFCNSCSKSIDRQRCQTNEDQNYGFLFFFLVRYLCLQIGYLCSRYITCRSLGQLDNQRSTQKLWILGCLKIKSMLAGRKIAKKWREKGADVPRFISSHQPVASEVTLYPRRKSDMEQKKGRNIVLWRALGRKHEAAENYTFQRRVISVKTNSFIKIGTTFIQLSWFMFCDIVNNFFIEEIFHIAVLV